MVVYHWVFLLIYFEFFELINFGLCVYSICNSDFFLRKQEEMIRMRKLKLLEQAAKQRVSYKTSMILDDDDDVLIEFANKLTQF